MITPEVIAELRELEAKASSGPWTTVNHETYCGGMGCTPNGCPGHDTGTAYFLDGPRLLPDGEVSYSQEWFFLDPTSEQVAKEEEEEAEAKRVYLQADIDCKFIVLLRQHARQLIELAEQHSGVGAGVEKSGT